MLIFKYAYFYKSILKYAGTRLEVHFYVVWIFIILNTGGGGIMRTKITLACTECKQRNYNTTKDKKTHPDRMEIRKYCRFCRTHTLQKETK